MRILSGIYEILNPVNRYITSNSIGTNVAGSIVATLIFFPDSSSMFKPMHMMAALPAMRWTASSV